MTYEAVKDQFLTQLIEATKRDEIPWDNRYDDRVHETRYSVVWNQSEITVSSLSVYVDRVVVASAVKPLVAACFDYCKRQHERRRQLQVEEEQQVAARKMQQVLGLLPQTPTAADPIDRIVKELDDIIDS